MHILIVRNNSNSQAIDASLLLVTYLATQGIDYTVVDSSKLASPLAAPELSDLFEHGVDMAVALGGDGTILRTARQVGFHGTPILGINYGRLGFLANPNESGVMEPLVAALSGDATHEVRTNLDIRVVCEGEADPYADDGAGAEPDEPRDFFALNEVAVTRG
ncbi:NAD(+)/NADH kinase, partial [Senegalimassilia anaerobia]|uniref:NAD(+)/NADH kinase n=2 Tax=Senegalimassilia TaxID=1473205 RepID=UPI003A981782